jgi:hypothetical protein
MKITVPSALLTTFLFGGGGRGGGIIVRAFSSSSSSVTGRSVMISSRTAAAAAAGGIQAGFKNNGKTTAKYHHYSTTSALRGSAAAPGGVTKVTTTKARPTKLTTTTTTTMMEEMINKTDVFIFDCDGVIWRVREEIFYFDQFTHKLFVYLKNIRDLLYSPERERESPHGEKIMYIMSKIYKCGLCVFVCEKKYGPFFIGDIHTTKRKICSCERTSSVIYTNEHGNK